MIRYPTILAYHTKIGIYGQNGVDYLNLELTDFYSTDDILKMLSAQYHAKTAGELIDHIKSSDKSKSFDDKVKVDLINVSQDLRRCQPDIPIISRDTAID